MAVTISNSERAGRAPYNFVPLPDNIAVAEAPPEQNQYIDKRHSGRIELTLEPLTPFFVRGMLPLDEFRKGKEIKDQPEPFSVAGKVRLPGSSIRGMVRTLVEILGKAPLEPVEDKRFAFRGVGATQQPTGGHPPLDLPTFEPYAKQYMTLLRDVKGGYLREAGGVYTIVPAVAVSGGMNYGIVDIPSGPFFSFRTRPDGAHICGPRGDDPDRSFQTWWIGKQEQGGCGELDVNLQTGPAFTIIQEHITRDPRLHVPCFIEKGKLTLAPESEKAIPIYVWRAGKWFYAIAEGKQFRHERFRFRTKVYFATAAALYPPHPSVPGIPQVQSWHRAEGTLPRGWAGGSLICSGYVPSQDGGKHNEWVIGAPGGIATTITVDDNSRRAHEEAGILDWVGDFKDLLQGEGIPCFYIEVPEDQQRLGMPKYCFGPTRYFRLPYPMKVQAANPTRRGTERDVVWDLGESMFGRIRETNAAGVETKSGRRGRVAFEDAVLHKGAVTLDAEQKTVLGTPRPTTFQHYVDQQSEKLKDSIHWNVRNYKNDAQDPRVRGHKLYWHHPDPPPLPNVTDLSNDVKTCFKLAHGTGATKFTALIRFENLTDVELGALLCAVQLPGSCAHHLGMGKPLGWGSFRITAKLLVMKPEHRYTSIFATGLEARESSTYQDAFAEWCLCQQNAKIADLWKDSRLKQLAALLEFDALRTQPHWNERTRYLQFGKGSNKDMNEYLEVLPNRRKSRRRPLPPATQVLNGTTTSGSQLPQDP